MKRAFTMIELIFVIVILGILAAVALPKFIGVAQQAHEANLKSFTGTLNRSVGPTLWSKAIADGKNGDISKLDDADLELSKYTDIPKEIDEDTIDLKNCDDSTSFKEIAKADKDAAGADYSLKCKDGDATHAPSFVLVDSEGNCLAGPCSEYTSSSSSTSNDEDNNDEDNNNEDNNG